MRGLIGFSALAFAACSSGTANDGSYLNDASFRRDALVRCLVNPQNGYGTKRLTHYDSGDARDWSRLPESNPQVAVLDQHGNFGPSQPLDLSAEDLGEQAFFRYPVQQINSADASVAGAESAGFWSDAQHGLGGLVRITYDSGLSVTALTCSTCHSHQTPSGLTIGAPNATLDLGWGPALLDVTTDDGNEPVMISDLRPVKFLTYLHHDGNVKQRDLTTLAIRIETLIITSHAQASRPPREIALALARYVWSLANALPAPPAASSPGGKVFANACGNCHAPDDGFTGPPVAIAAVGTDAALGLSSERGTGNYRVPSLRGVGTRSPLLHDASIANLTEFLDPKRPGGHRFGLDLDDASRAALLAYVSAL
ncbi:MAG: hypothetical protein ABI461_05135 [Polyangiaceae bacterium]